MNVLDAAYATVHDYKGGAAALAPRVGMAEAVLNSKVNPNTSTHHLRLDEASKLIALTGDYRILHALCAEHGFIATQLPEDGEASEKSLFEKLLETGKHNGAVFDELHRALEDGIITDEEVASFDRVTYALSKSVVELRAKFKSMRKKLKR